MKIRRLEIQGFKSFADRTVLKFGDGITGVVGPNGCGKSNIVDAIRWVMGEQSAKHLRGMGMQDVIFAGCESRGPAGMAEVTVSFKNDGALVPPEYKHHDELQVTRRLYRDGTSEYAINKVTCRLRDILDLFMGTGVGKNAYAIIEQGRIGMIVTARPEERRALIEDAAGVSRYKARRKQAERRIAATEQNLLRVSDLVAELGGRLGVLEIQAAKAAQYKALKAELRELDLHAAAHRHLELDAIERFERQAASELEVSLSDEQSGVQADEENIAQEMEALAEQESVLRAQEAAVHESLRALELAKQNVEFLLREDGKLAERIEEAELESDALRAERERLETERGQLETLESTLDEGAGAEVRLLETREVALEAFSEQIGEARNALEADKAALVACLTSVAERRNALENLSRRTEDLDARALVAEQNVEASRGRASDAQKRMKKLERELTTSRQLKLKLDEERTTEEDALAEHRSALTDLESHLSKTREQLLDRRSRLRSLEQIRSNYEGCSDAVRAVMGRGRDGVHGLVADILTSDPRYEVAVEALLGERLQSVVVAEQGDGFEAVRYLREAGKGRSTFVPLDLRLDHAPWAPRRFPPDRTSSAPPRRQAIDIDPLDQAPSLLPTPSSTGRPETAATAFPPLLSESRPPSEVENQVSLLPVAAGSVMTQKPTPTELPVPDTARESSGVDEWFEEEDGQWPNLADPEVCGRMSELVRTKPGYEHVAQALLGDVVVVESLEKAHEIWVNNGHRKTMVTLEGEVLDPMGLFTGGSSSGVSEGLLAQKREMEALAKEVTHLQARVQAAEEKKRDLSAKSAKLEARVKALSAEGQQGALSIVSFEKDLASLRERIAQERATSDQAEEEAARLRAELRALGEEQAATEEALAELETERSVLEHRVGDASDGLTELERKARDLADEVTTLKVDVAANREKRDSSKQSLAHIVSRLEDAQSRLDKLASTLERSADERSQGVAQVEADRKRIAVLEKDVQTADKRLQALTRALDKDRAQVKTRENKVRRRREALEKVRARLNRSQMKQREVQIARENLLAQISERYRIELPDVLTDFHLFPKQSEEHVQLTKKLRRRLSDFGAINLTAIDEFQVVKERHGHLASQKSDLEQAIEALRSAIRKINKTSLDRYVEAFRLVNEKFQQVFPKVFAGGRCALVLTDESDPLESGIEIMAQPPGKKLQSVNLLSGGEKALTAVSLIFAIFLIKPTPFCLLDEVDAPLDEANVGRYNEMLREMSPISQFVLITHNKRTMELPDRLYGVTMEIPGVSKIVPVDMVTSDPNERDLRAV